MAGKDLPRLAAYPRREIARGRARTLQAVSHAGRPGVRSERRDGRHGRMTAGARAAQRRPALSVGERLSAVVPLSPRTSPSRRFAPSRDELDPHRERQSMTLALVCQTEYGQRRSKKRASGACDTLAPAVGLVGNQANHGVKAIAVTVGLTTTRRARMVPTEAPNGVLQDFVENPQRAFREFALSRDPLPNDPEMYGWDCPRCRARHLAWLIPDPERRALLCGRRGSGLRDCRARFLAGARGGGAVRRDGG